MLTTVSNPSPFLPAQKSYHHQCLPAIPAPHLFRVRVSHPIICQYLLLMNSALSRSISWRKDTMPVVDIKHRAPRPPRAQLPCCWRRRLKTGSKWDPPLPPIHALHSTHCSGTDTICSSDGGIISHSYQRKLHRILNRTSVLVFYGRCHKPEPPWIAPLIKLLKEKIYHKKVLIYVGKSRCDRRIYRNLPTDTLSHPYSRSKSSFAGIFSVTPSALPTAPS